LWWERGTVAVPVPPAKAIAKEVKKYLLEKELIG